MKKPSKGLMIGYLIWCTINLFIALWSLFSCGWWGIDEFFPFDDGNIEVYDIIELIVYCGIPVLVYWIYCVIDRKYYYNIK
jgi:hypothetical protein